MEAGVSWGRLFICIAMFGQMQLDHSFEKCELVTTIYISVLGLIFGSYFMFLAEKNVAAPDSQAHISTYADAMWWGVLSSIVWD
ncbi:hypothetical protein D918_02325 [Trichuris suis]|nr:hypothetical protein D918_02325 [Trichuris suis]